MDNNNLSFLSYYLKHIQNNEIGLKPVRGATGLGKTFGLIQAVKKALEEGTSKKFIYITNRHALIREVEKDFLEKADIKAIYLKNDKQILLELIKNNKLKSILDELIQSGFFKYDSHNFAQMNDKQVSLHFQKQIERIDKAETLNIDRDNDEGEASYLDMLLFKLSKEIKNPFKYIKKNSPTKYSQFLKDKNIWQLFPYIQFENDDESKVLLGTIQKFCYGFFDGKKKQKITALQNRVIFLDEFDFLEKEILGILCKETPLNNPLEFVKIFYERFPSLMNKNFWTKHGIEDVKERLNQVYAILLERVKNNKYHFPQLTDFIFSDKFKKEKDLVLFQTNQTISDNFYLFPRKHEWEITHKKYKDAIPPLEFFKMIREAVSSILDTLSFSMERSTEITNNLIEKIWNRKNDNLVGAYHQYIEDVLVYKNANGNIGQQNMNDFSYKQGFSLIKIIHEDTLDDLDADLKQIELHISPEAIIQQLSNRNLVFALSATSDIPRMVNCFSERWLKSNTQFILPDEKDEKLLWEMKVQKDNIRNSKIIFVPNMDLDESLAISKYIKNLAQVGFYNSDSSSSEAAIGKRKERLSKFLGCVDWILNQSQNRSHLIFLDTFKHCLLFIKGETGMEMSEKLKEGWKVEDLEGGMGYKLSWNQKTCHIIFLDSKKAQEIEEDKIQERKESEANNYDKIMSDTSVDKIILVTQYATASNGVNLSFTDAKGVKRDFEGVHLLEGRYYWFDTPDKPWNKDISKQKQTYWYLWKLKDNNRDGNITPRKLKEFLKMQNLNVNSYYQNNGKDYILNSIALFHQAIGRVERQREYEQAIVEITLGEDVLKVFRDFLKEEIQSILEIKHRELYTATTILQLYDSVSLYLRKEKISLPDPQNIYIEEEKGKEIINRILDELTKIKKGEYSNSEENMKIARELIHIWKEIRKRVLEQDYDAEILIGTTIKKKGDIEVSAEVRKVQRIIGYRELTFKCNFSYGTNYIKEGGIVYMTTKEVENGEPKFNIYKENTVSIENLSTIDLNAPFNIIKGNEIIKTYFERRYYELSYIDTNDGTKLAFTPYIEQSILKGAIGEEGITALLESHYIHCQDLDEIDIRIFEVADAKIEGLPIYLDFKNFSENTVFKYQLRYDDLEYNPKTDPKELAKKIAKKLRHIRSITGEADAKFVLINLALPEGYRNQCFKLKERTVEELRSSDMDKADIIIIPHAILKEKPNELSKPFKRFATFIKKQLKTLSH